MAKKIRKNVNTKKVVYRGIAVGMAAVMGGVPVSAAAADVSKEETVYVNADASGNTTDVTVSNWLKNSNGDSTIKDKSDLQDIENVKGDETYTGSGDSMSWQADGSDIYYQGTTSKELPVSVKLKYFLDGVETDPNDLVGKSGKLKIQVNYENKAKTTTKIDGKTENIYNPFVMVTGMILPDEHFSNIVIDNGKVVSDGSRNIDRCGNARFKRKPEPFQRSGKRYHTSGESGDYSGCNGFRDGLHLHRSNDGHFKTAGCGQHLGYR